MPSSVANPRRPNWNPNASERAIQKQIKWELYAQQIADCRLYVFPENTLAPIALLELGLFMRDTNFVYCAKGYWRYTNVRTTCNYFGTPCYTNWDEFKKQVRDYGVRIVKDGGCTISSGRR